MYPDNLHKVEAIKPANTVMRTAIQGNRAELTLEILLTALAGELSKRGVPEYTYSSANSAKEAETFRFLETEINRLLTLDVVSLFRVLQKVLDNRSALRVCFDPDKKEIFVLKSDYEPSDNEADWEYEYGVHNSEILDLDFDLVVDGIDRYVETEFEYLMQETGEVVDETQFYKEHPEKNVPQIETAIERYCPGSDSKAYVFSKEDYYRIPVRDATLTVPGNVNIKMGQWLELKGLQSLSGKYKILGVEHDLSPGHFKTVIELVGTKEVFEEESSGGSSL